MSKKILSASLSLIMVLVAVFSCFSFASAESCDYDNNKENTQVCKVNEDSPYLTPKEVASYIYKFRHLPCNYVTKRVAQKAGWVPRNGNLQIIIPGGIIGGDWFTNYQKLVPTGYRWNECDVNYHGGRRGCERLLFNKECTMVYYTGDHYKTATLMER